MKPARPRGFWAGFFVGLGWFGILWFWIVDFRFTCEIVAVADRTVGNVHTYGGFLFPTSTTQIPLPSGAGKRVLVIGGFRSIFPATTVVLDVQPAGTREGRLVTVKLKAPLLARHCTAIVVLEPTRADAGPCVAPETSWLGW